MMLLKKNKIIQLCFTLICNIVLYKIIYSLYITGQIMLKNHKNLYFMFTGDIAIVDKLVGTASDIDGPWWLEQWYIIT